PCRRRPMVEMCEPRPRCVAALGRESRRSPGREGMEPLARDHVRAEDAGRERHQHQHDQRHEVQAPAGTQMLIPAGSTSTLNNFSFVRSLPSTSYRTLRWSFTSTERALVMWTNGELATCFRAIVLPHCM